VLAKFKFLRGTPLDPFGRLKDRKEERALIGEYEQMVDFVLANLKDSNRELCAELLSLPDDVRGYGPVKEAGIKRFRVRRMQLQARLASEDPARKKAA